MKVALLRAPRLRWASGATRTIDIAQSLPFFRTERGSYVHRVRHAQVHTMCWSGKSHASFHCWCGVTGYISNNRGSANGLLLAATGLHDVVCATCEGRAIGSGLLGAPMIAGQPVRFAPRIEGVSYPRPRPILRWRPPEGPMDEGPDIEVIIRRRDTGERL